MQFRLRAHNRSLSRLGNAGWNVFAGVALFVGIASFCRAQNPAPVDLTGTSLADLMNIQVTSVSMKEQSLSKAASSVYVITQDDIRRSGRDRGSRPASHGPGRGGCPH